MVKNDIDVWILEHRDSFPLIPVDESRFAYVINNRDFLGFDLALVLDSLEAERVTQQTYSISGELLETVLIKDASSATKIFTPSPILKISIF